MIKKRFTQVLIAALIFTLVAVGGSTNLAPKTVQAAPAGFVYRCGIHFCLDGKFYYFAGANSYDIFTIGGSFGDTETQYMDKTKTDAHFAKLQADGVMVVRLWMFDHESWHGFEQTKGVFNEQQWSLFDYVIESAKAHGIKLIPVFENYWEAYGGIDTRLTWEGLTGGHPGRAIFFNKSICPGCFTQYKNAVSFALNRINHYSGIAYKNDPTIFAWELMNEPRYQGVSTAEDTNGTTLRAWVDEMGAYIKGIDPNHMLGTGLEGHESRYGFGGNEGNPFVFIHQSPYIDFTSAHPYFDESWANLTIAQGRAVLKQWISDSHNIVGKPFFMGEFNVHNNVPQWWQALYDEMQLDDGDGSAFWNYGAVNVGTTFDVNSSSPEMVYFRQHVQFQRGKNGPIGPTSTPCASCPTPTNTPTFTKTFTPSPTNTPAISGALKVQIVTSGTDNNQQTAFKFKVMNVGSTTRTSISARIYFTLDGTNAASNYMLEKYYDQSAVAVVSGPTQASANIYYFTVNFGTASLAGGGAWEFHTGLHLANWGSNFDSSNDWFHTGYAVGALPAAYTDTTYIPAYISGTLSWGGEPGGSTSPTNTPISATNTLVPPTKTNTPAVPTNTLVPPTKTNTPISPSATPVVPTATRTNTPIGPTATTAPATNTPVPPTKTNTPIPPSATTVAPSATLNASDPCASPTVITGGGTFAITTTAKCFKYVNTTFVRGGMFSVMKDASSTSDTLKWYGGLDQNVTACSNQTSTISGNGGQLNNFTVAKDVNGQMFLTITGSAANNVTISITNWQNGNGCSVVPTVHP